MLLVAMRQAIGGDTHGVVRGGYGSGYGGGYAAVTVAVTVVVTRRLRASHPEGTFAELSLQSASSL